MSDDAPDSPMEERYEWESFPLPELDDAPLVGASRPGATKTISLPPQEVIPGSRKTNEWGIFKEASMNKKTLQYVDGCLKVNYPKGSASPGVGPAGGFTMYAKPACFPCNEARVDFEVFFPADFPWNKGGKLGFGLFINQPGASGGHHPKDGSASLRVMWRPGGEAEAYVYRPSGVPQHPAYKKIPGLQLNDEYGDSLFRGTLSFTAGKWNKVSLNMKLNSLDTTRRPVPDGKLALTVNGKTMAYDKMVWREREGIQCSGVQGGSFFGGSNKSWATPKDIYVLHRNISVTVC
jgi:polysaccharide lyase-like protein